MYKSCYENVMVQNNIPNDLLAVKIKHWYNNFVGVVYNRLENIHLPYTSKKESKMLLVWDPSS